MRKGRNGKPQSAQKWAFAKINALNAKKCLQAAKAAPTKGVRQQTAAPLLRGATLK